MNHYENSAPNTSDNKAKAEEILSKHTGEEGIYLTHGMIRGSDAIDAMLEFASLKQEEWVSVDTLPTDRILSVLVFNGKAEFYSQCISQATWFLQDKKFKIETITKIAHEDITHWQPLPKPPQQ